MRGRPQVSRLDSKGSVIPNAGVLGLVASAFEAADVGLILFDDSGTVLVANVAAHDHLGSLGGDLVGHHIGLVLPRYSEDGPAPFLDLNGQVRGVGGERVPPTGLEVEALRPDGSTFPVRLEVAQFVYDEQTFYLGTCHDMTERAEHSHRAADLARHDRATGCLNRFGLEDRLNHLIGTQPARPLGIAYVDLSGLESTIDRCPSDVATSLVEQAVTRLRGVLQGQDELARVGRHEFVAVFVPDGKGSDIGLATERLGACLQEPLESATWRVPPKASIGVSLYPQHAATADMLIDRSETAMRRAKRSAAQGAHLYSLKDDRHNAARGVHLEQVREAAERHEFTLFYQPQFDLATLQTTGLEALLRWQHPDKGIIAPRQFLSLIVECGLISTVTRQVLGEAVAFNTRLAAEGILDVPIAVNVGPETFEDRGFVDLVSEVLDDAGMPAERLEIEITEAAAITLPGQVAANARALRSLGVSVAIDDFGTGFSSLKRLRMASFSKLKIDRTFVGCLPGDSRDQRVIEGLLDLAAGLEMTAVAEGIETEEQLLSLRALGCRYGQGYWYGGPMAEDALRTWIGRSRDAVP